MPERLHIESIAVKGDRVEARVRMASPVRVLTTPKLAAYACERFPDLPRHACVNGEGPAFGAVMDHTPLPHLLEHLVIDLQTRACPDPDVVFTGATRWIDRPAALASVQVSYRDDLVALRAFRDAVDFLNHVGESALP